MPSQSISSPSLRREIKMAVNNVNDALAQLRGQTQLVGYDITGIQELVFSSRRPRAIKSCSVLIKQLDESFKASLPANTCRIFSGGGRGLFLAASPDQARDLCKVIREKFAKELIHGNLVTEHVPLERSPSKGGPEASITRLRQRMESAKEAAIPYAGVYPAGRGDECEGCGHWKAEKPWKAADYNETLCCACHQLMSKGKDLKGISFVDVAEDGFLAFVSADGNGFGTFFSSLKTLEAWAAASVAIHTIFEGAHQAALETLKLRKLKYLDPVFGGDDIKVLMPPSALLKYVQTLVEHVYAGIREAGNLEGVLDSQQHRQFQSLGVGIGAIIADAKFPATRLRAYAQQLEDRAKSHRSTLGTPLRSTFDLEWLISYDGDAGITDAKQHSPYLPADPGSETWNTLISQATALSKVPTSQLTLIAQRHQYSEAEFDNLLRYQVARTTSWKHYFRDIQVDWTQAENVKRACPDTRLLTLGKLLQRFPDQEPASSTAHPEVNP